MAEQAGSQSSLLLVLSEQKEQQQSFSDNLLYKNRLQEFTQRAHIQFPVYHTVNEAGPRDLPKFRSTVEVDGETYSCLNTFSSRKAAEKDVAKIALEGIYKKIQNCITKKTTEGGFPPILQDKIFCKSILHEFATKMNMEKPKYDTAKVEGLIPVFTSSLVFNGMKYPGGPSVSKKEAEQLAARAAILSILADSGLGMHLLEIVKSKGKFYSAVHDHISGDTDASLLQSHSGTPVGTSAIKVGSQSSHQAGELGNVVALTPPEADQASNLITNVVSEVHQGESHVQPTHEFRKPGIETISQAVPLPIAFVPSTQAENYVIASISGGKRKGKRRKKANKKAKTEIIPQAAELPLSQPMPCTIAL
ncbi:hypothetical protein BVRB_2g027800 [Beta vulgaris subsp. vulgaris]|nr:hypothetical protein BVRB_2g027800 [Beta vulgaris subsp. vulgaris]